MLNWFRRRPADAGSAHAAGEESSAAPVPMPMPSPPAEPPGNDPDFEAATAAAPADPFTEAIARDRIADRLVALLGELPAALQRTDAPSVLGALAESMDTSIGQPPAAAQKALAVSRDPTSSVGQLVELFAQDPGLAQELLRHANSGYYAGPGGSVTSLATAVQRIGSAGVENVLLASTVRGVLCRPGGGYDSLVDQVWSHCVRCGPIARDLAPAFKVDPERAFALALLHDAGKLILFEHVSAFRRKHRRDVNIPMHLLLWALKRLHESMGGLAALRWGLSEDAARAISRHHRSPAPSYEDPLSEVIFVAERLDLEAIRRTPPDLDAWWREGALLGDRTAAGILLEEREAA